MDKILLVDDDDNILAGYQRNLRKMFNIVTAASGKEGLELIYSSGPFSVVMSDFKMPVMNGNQFLAKVKQTSPDSVRMMLTGFADVETAINAVNEGNIFRLLTKPCPHEKLINSLYAALEQHRLVIAERELLDKTLKGSIKVLTDILSVVNPMAFSQASMLRKIARKIGEKIQVKNLWKLELSALLSQIGCVAVPTEILEKKVKGFELSEYELKIFNSHPAIGYSLIENIPRLEDICEAIKYQSYKYDGSDEPEDYVMGDKIPVNARILAVLNDYFSFTQQDMSNREAMKKLYEQEHFYDPTILAALDAEITGMYDGFVVESVFIKELEPGMVLAEEIKNLEGTVLLTKNYEITNVLIHKLKQYLKMHSILEPVKVLVLPKK